MMFGNWRKDNPAATGGRSPGGDPGLLRERVTLSVRKWLLALVLCSVASLTVLSIYFKWQAERIYGSTAYANAHSIPSIVALDEARAHAMRLRLLLQRHVVDPNAEAKRRLEDRIYAEQALAGKSLQNYEHLSADEPDKRMLEEDRRLLAGYIRGAQDILASSRAGETANAQGELMMQAEVGEKLGEALDRHIHYKVTQGLAVGDEAAVTFERASRHTLGFVLAVVAAMLTVGFIIARLIAHQVERIRILALDNDMFRTMMECARDQPVTVHDVDNGLRIVYANAAACRHFGVDLETLLGWGPGDFDACFDPEMQRGLIASWEKHGSYMFETVHRIAIGELIPVEVASNIFEHGSRRLSICLTRDLRPRIEEEARMLALERLQAERESMQRLDRFARSAPGVMYTMTLRHGYLEMTYVSPAAEDVFGVAVENVLAAFDHFESCVVPEDLEMVCHLRKESARTRSLFRAEYRIRHVLKGVRWLENLAVPEALDDGSLQWHGFVTDVTERKLAEIALISNIKERMCVEEELAQREREYRTLVDHSPEMVIRYDRACRRIFVNRAFERIFGWSKIEAIALPLAESWVPLNMSSKEYTAHLRQVMDSGEQVSVILEWQQMNGSLVSHDMRMVPEYDEAGQARGVLVIGHDITRLRQAEIALRRREQEFRALVEHSPDMVARYDRDCRRIYANPRMLGDGVPLDELLQRASEESSGGENASVYQDRIRHVFESGNQDNFELTGKSAAGKEFCFHIRLAPEFDDDGNVAVVLAVGHDITEIDAYRKQIHNLAFYDNLTGLPNRVLLIDRIRQTIADASWHGHEFGLMMLDLDRFKEINDTLGHGVGDQVLREAAERLQACVRVYDMVARLGGDEFAILLPQIRDGEDLGTIARKILEAFNQPLVVDGRELFVSTSIGIALYPADNTEIDALFRFADSAMYHAKKQGRNNFQFYSVDLTVRTANRMSVESALRRAVSRRELELYYQPQVDLGSGRVIGAEALLRWRRGGKVLTPDSFIAIAEETGLIVSIGAWVLEAASRTAAEWNRECAEPLRVAVNLSTRQFILNDLVGTVRSVLAETGCRPDWLKLEITESLLLEDNQEIVAALRAFEEMGLGISIDDFGTGYSALSYLNRFPVSQIKIDRSFVRDIPQDRDKAELVKAMISIAKSLRLDMVAEGVETGTQADYLLAQGCTKAQGYLFGNPMPRVEFEHFITEQQSSTA